MDDRRRSGSQPSISPWWAMWSGMRAYGAAIVTLWALSATTVLAVLSVATGTSWLRATFAAGALVELVGSALTFWFLQRLNNARRFDV